MYETYSQMLNREDPPLHNAITEPLRTPMSLYNKLIPFAGGGESCGVLLPARFGALRIYEYGRASRYSCFWLLLRDFFVATGLCGYGNFAVTGLRVGGAERKPLDISHPLYVARSAIVV